MKDISFGYCHCGCGNKTPLSTRTRSDTGLVKGEPLRFIRGHIGRLNAVKGYQNKIRTESDGSILKLCTCCGIHKQISPDSCFNKSAGRLERWRAWCKDCERTKANEFYHKNPDSYKKRARIFQTELRKLLKERGERIKAMYGCRLCGESEISCLDFHHLLEKERNIGNASTTASFEKELVKCVVLCSNCHRKVHSGVSKVSTDMLCKKHDGI